MTDVVGHIVDSDSATVVRIRTRHGDVVEVDIEDVLAVRVVPEMPVRTGQIRNLEHAAALAWPGTEQEWLDGWLLRHGRGVTRRANSAVPLRFSSFSEITAVAQWYAERGQPAVVSAPDRLIRLPDGVVTDAENLVMTTDVEGSGRSEVSVAAAPDAAWLQLYQRDVPVDVLTATVGARSDSAPWPARPWDGWRSPRRRTAPDGPVSRRCTFRRAPADRAWHAGCAWGCWTGRTRIAPPGRMYKWSKTIPLPARCMTRWASGCTTDRAMSGPRTCWAHAVNPGARRVAACAWLPGTSTPSAPGSTV